ncbi:hypothetical protein DAI22_03g185701 [Oryza sativa Japonica Group]|nr:hypothetical protein DAI22_03g185701 [Oryza sativa Japonica Group]
MAASKAAAANQPLEMDAVVNGGAGFDLSSDSYKGKVKALPLWKAVGEEGFEPPTPWFVATCSNPLSYRPTPSPLDLFPGYPQKEPPSPQPFHFGLRRWENPFLSIRIVRSEV